MFHSIFFLRFNRMIDWQREIGEMQHIQKAFHIKSTKWILNSDCVFFMT